MFANTEPTQHELEIERSEQLRLWRQSPNDGALGLWVTQLFLISRETMPDDLQEWLSDCIELSRVSNGEITLDKAFGITDSGTKENAYNKKDIEFKRDSCIAIMEYLIDVCGIEQQSVAARLVFAREEPEGIKNPNSLAVYYSTYNNKKGKCGETRDNFRSTQFYRDLKTNKEQQLSTLETFLKCAEPKDKKKLVRLIQSIKDNLP